eukprot:IDg15606t1
MLQRRSIACRMRIVPQRRQCAVAGAPPPRGEILRRTGGIEVRLWSERNAARFGAAARGDTSRAATCATCRHFAHIAHSDIYALSPLHRRRFRGVLESFINARCVRPRRACTARADGSASQSSV